MAHIPKTGQAGTELGEIEVTPEMVEAGVRVYFDFKGPNADDYVKAIFVAMWSAYRGLPTPRGA